MPLLSQQRSKSFFSKSNSFGRNLAFTKSKHLLLPLLAIQFTTSVLAMSSSSTTTPSSQTCKTDKPAALVFLHGLGDSPAGWSHLEDQLPSLESSLSNLEYVFPAAPQIPLTVNGGMVTPGWFDLFDWPIGVGCKRDGPGLERSVETVESCVTTLVQKGIERDRIVIGGFSQGGAIAMQAAYSKMTAGDAYAGCVSLSGWVNFDEVHESVKDTPLFWGHGQYDDKVLFEQQDFGARTLVELGVSSVESQSYPMAHSSHPEEMKAFASFLDKVLYK